MKFIALLSPLDEFETIGALGRHLSLETVGYFLLPLGERGLKPESFSWNRPWLIFPTTCTTP
jgi:hypothetical protein